MASTDQYWVHISLDGHELTPRGGFASADEAEVMAARMSAICRMLHQQVATWVVPAETPREEARHG